MGSLVIVKPIQIAAVLAGPARAWTPDPREAITLDPAGGAYKVDAGSVVTVDSAFIGYHNAGARSWQLHAMDAAGNVTGSLPLQSTAPLGYVDGPTGQHAFARGGPLTSRYFQLNIAGGGASAASIGVLAIGQSFQAQYGTEWGAGRLIEDTGTAERLFGGSFAIEDGAAAGGYQWTFGDLQPDEIRALYRLVKDRRTTRSILVVEDPDQTDGLNERIHWGLFGKLDAYERLNPQDTKWGLSVRDWA